SSALRRLGAKTQVLGAGANDFVRTRLTHSHEVAQVGRDIGAELGCAPDIVDAARLFHDLGHPPFGHNDENVLDDLAAPSCGCADGLGVCSCARDGAEPGRQCIEAQMIYLAGEYADSVHDSEDASTGLTLYLQKQQDPKERRAALYVDEDW